MVSTLFLSILMAISYSFARATFVSVRNQEAKSDAQEVMLMAIDLLTRDVRLAGFSAAGQRLTGIRVAARQRVEVAADFDGDGETDGTNELVAYSYNDEKHQLVRATGGSSPQPLMPNVPASGVRFSYYDANGTEIPVMDGTLALEDRRRIHRVDVVLQAEVPGTEPESARVTSAASASICLRNQ